MVFISLIFAVVVIVCIGMMAFSKGKYEGLNEDYFNLNKKYNDLQDQAIKLKERLMNAESKYLRRDGEYRALDKLYGNAVNQLSRLQHPELYNPEHLSDAEMNDNLDVDSAAARSGMSTRDEPIGRVTCIEMIPDKPGSEYSSDQQVLSIRDLPSKENLPQRRASRRKTKRKEKK